MDFIKLNTDAHEMMSLLYPHYQMYEAEISKAKIEEIFPNHLGKENYRYFENYFKRGITTYLCVKNKTIVGFVSYHIDRDSVKGYAEGYDGWGHLAEIYTVKEYRGRGIGKIMVNKVEEEFNKLGISSIYIMDLSGNQSFWESMKYKDTFKIEPNEGGRIFEKQI